MSNLKISKKVLRIANPELVNFVEQNIVAPFYTSRTNSLQKIKLTDLLKRKNPYLFRAKNLKAGQDLVKVMLDAFLSSSEETIFVCQKNLMDSSQKKVISKVLI